MNLLIAALIGLAILGAIGLWFRHGFKSQSLDQKVRKIMIALIIIATPPLAWFIFFS